MKYLLSACIICILLSCKEESRKLPYYDTADYTPKWTMGNEDSFHKVRPFSYTTQENEQLTEKDMDGKITVVDFFFTACPGICPKLASSMGGLQDTFVNDNDILLLSHSVTPESDSVPVLAEYAATHKVNAKRWKLLTGKQSDIYDIGRRSYFVEEDLGVKSDSTIFLHTENFVLVDKNRHLRGIYNGLDPNSMARLVEDIKVLKKE